MNADERIATLRQRVLDRKNTELVEHLQRADVLTARSLRDSEGVDSWTLRRGLLTRDRLAGVRFAIDDLELLAGRLDLHGQEKTVDLENARTYLEAYSLAFPGQSGHCELDLDLVMTSGIDGVATQIRQYMAAGADSQSDTYQSFLHALDGLSLMIQHAAEMVEATAEYATSERQVELRAISAACQRVAHRSPETFRDAMQLLWFVICGVMQADQAYLVAPGHLDRTLTPFYERDIAQGRLDRESALELIECLYLLVNEYVGDGLAIPVMVGGQDAAGGDISNQLSALCLEALRRTRLIYPTVGLCWHEGTPAELLDLVVNLMGEGYANPAVFGDATIQTGLQALGVPPHESCRYMNSTCVEITPSGASNVWVASPYYNTCGLLLEEIQSQVDAPEPTFEGFVASYRQRLAAAVRDGVETQNTWRSQRKQLLRRPLQSVFTRDCMARGMDIEQGGATYNWIECSFIGLANLADSLYVIREEIYRQKKLSMGALASVLERNFEGSEAIRQRYLKTYPKYGQANIEVDTLFGETLRFIVDTCAQFSVEPDGSHYVPGAFAWVMHERLGRETR
ncbi:MAG: pyruvate formate lyase family protein, partial [Anaerolineae bacterium]|nr:pyruvate formate lyase family protein [Anaerolineae bacterium]